MQRSIAVRLEDSEQKIYRWVIRHVPNARPSGWEFEDHDGYIRFQEGNYRDLLARFRGTAENYGFRILTDLG